MGGYVYVGYTMQGGEGSVLERAQAGRRLRYISQTWCQLVSAQVPQCAVRETRLAVYDTSTVVEGLRSPTSRPKGMSMSMSMPVGRTHKQQTYDLMYHIITVIREEKHEPRKHDNPSKYMNTP